ncbi:MAG TPA: DMT family transporter [Gammaproteobacteria bacterium]|nr:DMT family transporter [Gammaproteobacteria bacterium]
MKNLSSLGMSLALISALAYAIQTAIVKHISGQISTPMLVFIQSTVCFILILPLILAKGRRFALQTLRTAHPIIHFFRTIFSLGISYFLFYAVKFIPLVDAVLLANTAPLLVPIIGFLFMSRGLNHRLWLPLIIGFLGIIFILKPDSQVFSSASFLALGAGICMATSIIFISEAKEDSGLTRAFYYFIFSVPISALGALWFWSPITLSVFAVAIGIGILFFIVQLTLVYAVKYTHVQIVSTLYLSNILFAAIISVIIWHTPVTASILAGILLTIAGAVFTIRAQATAIKPVKLEAK